MTARMNENCYETIQLLLTRKSHLQTNKLTIVETGNKEAGESHIIESIDTAL